MKNNKWLCPLSIIDEVSYLEDVPQHYTDRRLTVYVFGIKVYQYARGMK